MLFFLFLVSSAFAKIPDTAIQTRMNQLLSPLKTQEEWSKFVKVHKNTFGEVSEKLPGPQVGVEELVFEIDSEKYKVGMGVNTVFIKAPPKVVVSVVGNPDFFQSLFDLDKPARATPTKEDVYEARIFKIVPGIENQDYTLKYEGRWNEKAWIQRAQLVKDEKGFALRDNLKIVEPFGSGSLYREISLFFPKRWWLRMLSGTLKSVTARELTKVGRALKCASEKVEGGSPMTEEIGKACHKSSLN